MTEAKKIVCMNCGQMLYMIVKMPTELCLFLLNSQKTKQVTHCPPCDVDLDYEDVIEEHIWDEE